MANGLSAIGAALCMVLPLLLMLTCITCVCSSIINVHPVLYAEDTPSGPSTTTLLLRVLPRAISYLNSVAADLIADQLPRLRIARINQRISNGRGTVQLSNVHVSHFKRATLHNISTSAPNKLTWIMKNFNIGLIGDLSGRINVVVPLELEGKAEVQAQGVNFYLESALQRSESGAARVTTLSCRTTIKTVILENYNGGVAEIALNLFKQAISEHIRPIIQVLICKQVTRFINEDLNDKLTKTQTKLVLSDALKTNSFGALVDFPVGTEQFQDIFQSINISASYPSFQELANRVLVDFRLSKDPICYTNLVEIANLGQISLRGVNRSIPFGVPPLPKPLQEHGVPDAMLHLIVSDYIANALLYHVFEERLLQLVIDDDSVSSLSSFLRTTCSSSLCLADLLPQLADRFPNGKVKLVFTPSRAPVVIFQAKRNGVLTVNVNGLILIYVNTDNTSSSRQAAAFELDAVASNHLYIQNDTLLGNVIFDRFRLQNKYGSIRVSDEELSDIAFLSSEMLQKFMNEFLRTGFPIPIPKVIRLKAKKLQILDRTIFISSEFALDRRRVSDLAQKAFFETRLFSPVSGHVRVANTSFST